MWRAFHIAIGLGFRVLRPPSSSQNHTDTVTTGRRNKPVASAGVFLHLLFIAVIGAATVIMLGVASMSLLDSKGSSTRPRIGSAVLPHTDPNAEAISSEASSPILPSPKSLPTASPPSALIDETSELTETTPSSESPAHLRDASAVPSETPDPLPVRHPFSTDAIRPTEVERIETPREALPPAEASVTPDVIPSPPSLTIPPEKGDRIRGEDEIQQHQPANSVQGDLILDDKALAQKVRNKGVHRHPGNPNTVMQSRVQKECGPIIFPALRRHCIASFGMHRH
jgi:hypothetical protein